MKSELIDLFVLAFSSLEALPPPRFTAQESGSPPGLRVFPEPATQSTEETIASELSLNVIPLYDFQGARQGSCFLAFA